MSDIFEDNKTIKNILICIIKLEEILKKKVDINNYIDIKKKLNNIKDNIKDNKLTLEILLNNINLFTEDLNSPINTSTYLNINSFLYFVIFNTTSEIGIKNFFSDENILQQIFLNIHQLLSNIHLFNEQKKKKILVTLKRYYELIIKFVKTDLNKTYFMKKFNINNITDSKFYLADIYYINFLLLDDDIFQNEFGKILLIIDNELKVEYDNIKLFFETLYTTSKKKGFSLNEDPKKKLINFKQILINQSNISEEKQITIDEVMNENFLKNIKILCNKIKDLEINNLDSTNISINCDNITDVNLFLTKFKTYSVTLEGKLAKIIELNNLLKDFVIYIKKNCDSLLEILLKIVTNSKELQRNIITWIEDIKKLLI